MMLSDIATGITTLIILLLMSANTLEIWHLYILGIFAGTFSAFQWPAQSAAISSMIPKAQYNRAAGMMSLSEWLPQVFAQPAAVALMAVIGTTGIMTIDLCTLGFALLMLLIIKVPEPKVSAEGLASRGSLLKESTYGFRYIWQRPSLLGLQLVFFCGNLMATLSGTLAAPMILWRTNGSAETLANTNMIAAVGGILGSLAITAWGGFKRDRVRGVFGGWILSAIFGMVLFGLGQVFIVWAIALFLSNLIMPIINSSNQAIWQSKVPPDIQGKVFSVRRMIAQISVPVSMLVAGPLADKLMEPAMRDTGSAMATFFGPIVGTGPGAGAGLLTVITGLVTIGVGVVAFLIPKIRNVETIMPDHVEDGVVAEPAA
jgi:DHA3 family macrolide efflux protein-like MFS transporter